MVVLDRLTPSEQQALGDLLRDPNVYGILRPRDAHNALSVKSVSRDIALLLFTLQQPGRLPRYAVEALGDGLESNVARLVYDGILDIQVKGAMRSGPEAHQHLRSDDRDLMETNTLSRLSMRALRYAACLGIENRIALSTKLYAYNTVPASVRWRRLLLNEGAVEKYLGTTSNAVLRAIEGGWSRTPPGEGASWIGWTSRAASRHHSASVSYKLYVSPACADIPRAFEAVVKSITGSKAFHWKVGSNIYGLLRPDKMVVYFRDYSALQTTAANLLQRLSGCAAQGVPFTAELAPEGLLSWGVDPRAERYAAPWKGRVSWRSQICDVLAGALVHANAATNAGTPAWTFALERLRLEGIDTRTWTPTEALSWSDPQNG